MWNMNVDDAHDRSFNWSVLRLCNGCSPWLVTEKDNRFVQEVEFKNNLLYSPERKVHNVKKKGALFFVSNQNKKRACERRSLARFFVIFSHAQQNLISV